MRVSAMLDGVSIDYLRMFVASVDEGSFSAAGRRLHRAQSAVSWAITSLETQLGVTLFDRGSRYPRLTREGTAILAHARLVIGGLEALKARAKSMAAGVEAELAVVVDVFFPIDIVSDAVDSLRKAYPATALRLRVEALGATVEAVVEGQSDFGVVGPALTLQTGLTAEPLFDVPVVMVASPTHALAALAEPIPQRELEKHIQLVLTDRSSLSQGRDFAVRSPTTWRLADLFAKHAFLINGLGWGGMPLHAVASDIAAGRLVRLRLAGEPENGISLPMQVAHRPADPPGPAGRWLIERLRSRRGTIAPHEGPELDESTSTQGAPSGT